MKRLLSVISLFIVIMSMFYTVSAKQVERIQQPKQPETITYVIYSIDHNDYYGRALDGTGVYFTSNELKGQQVNTGDVVKVTYKDYETILNIKKEY